MSLRKITLVAPGPGASSASSGPPTKEEREAAWAACVKQRANGKHTSLTILMGGRTMEDKTAKQWCDWFEAYSSSILSNGRKATAREVNFSENRLTGTGVDLILKTFAKLDIPINILKLYKNMIEQAQGIVELLSFGKGCLRELHLSHNRLDNNAVLRIIIACATLKDDKGQLCYPQAEAPIWLRLEFNDKINGPKLGPDLQIKLRQAGHSMRSCICEVDGQSHCCPGVCYREGGQKPAVHLTYMRLFLNCIKEPEVVRKAPLVKPSSDSTSVKRDTGAAPRGWGNPNLGKPAAEVAQTAGQHQEVVEESLAQRQEILASSCFPSLLQNATSKSVKTNAWFSGSPLNFDEPEAVIPPPPAFRPPPPAVSEICAAFTPPPAVIPPPPASRPPPPAVSEIFVAIGASNTTSEKAAKGSRLAALQAEQTSLAVDVSWEPPPDKVAKDSRLAALKAEQANLKSAKAVKESAPASLSRLLAESTRTGTLEKAAQPDLSDCAQPDQHEWADEKSRSKSNKVSSAKQVVRGPATPQLAPPVSMPPGLQPPPGLDFEETLAEAPYEDAFLEAMVDESPREWLKTLLEDRALLPSADEPLAEVPLGEKSVEDSGCDKKADRQPADSCQEAPGAEQVPFARKQEWTKYHHEETNGFWWWHESGKWFLEGDAAWSKYRVPDDSPGAGRIYWWHDESQDMFYQDTGSTF